MDSNDLFPTESDSNMDLQESDFKGENLSIHSRKSANASMPTPSFGSSENGHNLVIDSTGQLDQTDDDILPDENLTNLNDDILTSIARSAFADMLHDQERNYLYKKAIKKVLGDLLEAKQYEKINCLDIGAGTGLLSMLMHRTIGEFSRIHPNLNVDDKKIIALEQFFYSYLSAKEIIALNKMNDKISLIYKNSMSERLPENERCDFLVTEVFDTELIGEGALEIFRDAKNKLLKSNALVVPKRARIYCQLIESKPLVNGHLFRPIRIKGKSSTSFLTHCDEINNCPGSCAQLNDMQLNSLSIDEIRLISDVQVAFEIEFDNPPENSLDCRQIEFRILRKKNSLSAVCVAVWWDLDMDPEGEIVLSCAPYWARSDVNYDQVLTMQPAGDVATLFKPEGGSSQQFAGRRNVEKELDDLRNCFIAYDKMLEENANVLPAEVVANYEKLRLSSQWRDHWMQAVYFLPRDSLNKAIISEDMQLEIQAFRNDYQFWFNYQHPYAKPGNDESLNVQPACVCGYHRVYSRNQIRQINDNQTTNVVMINFNELYAELQSLRKNRPSPLEPVQSVLTSTPVPSDSPFPDTNPYKKQRTEEPCNVFIFGGMGIIPVMIAKTVPESMIYLYNQSNACPFYKEIIFKERLEHKFLGVKNVLNFDGKIDIFVKDPCVDLDKLPWLDLHEFLFAYRCVLGKQIPLVQPNRVSFKVMPVCFDHLWKIRYVIKQIDGLDLMPFHRMVDKALESESRKIEMYGLHEYDGIALAPPQLIAGIQVANLESHKGETHVVFDLNCAEIRQRLLELNGVNALEENRSVFDQQLERVLPFRRSLSNVAFVIWPEYNKLVNHGPQALKVDYSSKIVWNKLFKQAVYFMPEFHKDYLSKVANVKIDLELQYDFTGEKNVFKLSHRNLLSPIV